jgi:hypothetical protein
MDMRATAIIRCISSFKSWRTPREPTEAGACYYCDREITRNRRSPLPLHQPFATNEASGGLGAALQQQQRCGRVVRGRVPVLSGFRPRRGSDADHAFFAVSHTVIFFSQPCAVLCSSLPSHCRSRLHGIGDLLPPVSSVWPNYILARPK